MRKLTFLLFIAMLTTAYGAIKFDGASCIDMGADSSLNIPTDGTLAAWVYINDLSGPRWVVSTSPNNGNLQFGLEYGRTANKFDVIWGASGFDILVSNSVLQTNTWQHLGVTRTGSGSSWVAKLYLNGNLDSTQNGVNAAATFARAVIGSYTNGCGQFPASGTIFDDIRIYNRALSDNEMASLGKSRLRLPVKLDPQQGLVGWWRLDDGKNGASVSGATVLDYSGHKNTGTPAVGTPTWVSSTWISYP